MAISILCLLSLLCFTMCMYNEIQFYYYPWYKAIYVYMLIIQHVGSSGMKNTSFVFLKQYHNFSSFIYIHSLSFGIDIYAYSTGLCLNLYLYRVEMVQNIILGIQELVMLQILWYRPFHKTLPRSSTFVNWISVRFYETDCKLNISEKQTTITWK